VTNRAELFAMSTIFDVKVRGPPNEDLVQGFPGIGASWPRLEGTVEVRSKDGSLLYITLVTIALYRTDVIHPPSNKPGISGPKKEQSYLIGEKLGIFQVSAGKIHEECIGLDLPFVLSLPTNKPLAASISLGKGTVETSYQLFISIIYGKQQLHHVPVPVRIKRYDTLSTFGAFRVPVVKTVVSSDHIVTLDYCLPCCSFGPTDSIMAYIKMIPNPDWPTKSKKVKLEKVTMQVVEVITFNHNGEEPIVRRRRLAKTSTEQLDLRLMDEWFNSQLTLEFPVADLQEKEGLIPKERQEIPIASKNGFTTASSLYKIDYLLIIKARLSHCKDIEIEQPITINPFDHASCMSFMKCISDSVEYSNKTNHNYKPRPQVYRTGDVAMLSHLQKLPSTVGNRIVQITVS
jgi:Arrestin (or S-antigen), C-terminal domain